MPVNIKSKEDLDEIIPMLQSNFLTKNLSVDEITRLA